MMSHLEPASKSLHRALILAKSHYIAKSLYLGPKSLVQRYLLFRGTSDTLQSALRLFASRQPFSLSPCYLARMASNNRTKRSDTHSVRSMLDSLYMKKLCYLEVNESFTLRIKRQAAFPNNINIRGIFQAKGLC